MVYKAMAAATLAMTLPSSAQASLTGEYTCYDEETCGVQKGFPDYYDPFFDPNSLFQSVKISSFAAFLIPIIYYKEERVAYKAHFGVEKTDYALSYLQDERAHVTDKVRSLELASLSSLGLWGTYFLFGTMAMTGFNKWGAAFWAEHIISNLQWPLNGYIGYLLYTGGFGWFDIGVTYVSFATTIWQLYNRSAVDAIRTLKPDYPYLDSTLIASVRYLVGIDDHLTQYPFMDVEWPSEEVGDAIDEEETDESEVFVNFKG